VRPVSDDYDRELTRRDRLAASARLDELAAEVAQIGRWLDHFGGDADKGAVLLECASRDLLAACWIVHPADHTRPAGWLAPDRQRYMA
jgi:hypothetical protein